MGSAVSDNIKKAREIADISYDELAIRTGIPKSTLQRYETGATAKIPMDAVSLIEKALNLSSGQLMGWKNTNTSKENFNIFSISNIHPVELKRFPLLGKIACGEPIFADEDKENYIMADFNIKADFCLTAQGDSMMNARIMDGDIVFIKSQPIVANGEIAVVIIDDEATLKRVYYDKEDGVLTLVPENPTCKTFRYYGEELDEIRILGKAVYFMSMVK